MFFTKQVQGASLCVIYMIIKTSNKEKNLEQIYNKQKKTELYGYKLDIQTQINTTNDTNIDANKINELYIYMDIYMDIYMNRSQPQLSIN